MQYVVSNIKIYWFVNLNLFDINHLLFTNTKGFRKRLLKLTQISVLIRTKLLSFRL